jgi:hypothetical protein
VVTLSGAGQCYILGMSNLRVPTLASLLLIAIAVGCSSSDQAALDKAG